MLILTTYTFLCDKKFFKPAYKANKILIKERLKSICYALSNKNVIDTFFQIGILPHLVLLKDKWAINLQL